MSTSTPSRLRELEQRFKKGYALEPTGSGHYRVRDPQGELVTTPGGKNLTLTGTAHGGRAEKNMETQLRNAGVLRASERTRPERKPGKTEAEKRTIEQRRQASAVGVRQRQEATNKLRERLANVLRNVGGLELPGMQADLAHVGALIGRERNIENNGASNPITSDLTTANISKVVLHQPIDKKYLDLWNDLAERLENADDLVEEWYSLVRRARGLPEEAIVVRKPVEGDWPFRVELLPIEALTVDHDYQRPVPWPFVRKIAISYDESLVGTIDVSERRRGAVFAILDGQLRYEATKLVGKKTVWASVYSGLDKASEARFFLHKNKDRKAIHPFYTFKARLIAGEGDAHAIEETLAKYGYRLSVGAARPGLEGNVSAIAAIETAYSRKRPGGGDALDPTLAVLRETTWGLPHGQNNVLIRGLSGVFAAFAPEEIKPERLVEILYQHGPISLLSRARQEARGGSSGEYALARVLVNEYNRGLPRTEQLERGRKIGG